MFFFRFSLKLKPILPTWRRRTRFILLNKIPVEKKFRLITSSRSGRNNTGSRVLNTKTHSLKFKVPLLGFNLLSRDTGYFIKRNKFNLKSSKFFNIWQGNLGSVKILPAIQGSFIGSRIRSIDSDWGFFFYKNIN